MRLRIGISLPFAPNAFVYARSLNSTDAANLKAWIAQGAAFGIYDGMGVGGIGKLVLSVS